MILPIETDKHGNPAHGAVVRALTMLIEEHNELVNINLHHFGTDMRNFLKMDKDPNTQASLDECIRLRQEIKESEEGGELK